MKPSFTVDARARSAAVQYLASGRAGSVELDDEHGVWLEDGFKPAASERDSKAG
jgi:hypothetical protein